MRNTFQATITGNLTRDPRVVGEDRCYITVAVNGSHYDSGQGKSVEHTTFVDCVLFRQNARAASDLLGKGMKVLCAGRLNIKPPREHNGRHYTDVELICSEMEILTPRGQGERRPAGDGAPAAAGEVAGTAAGDGSPTGAGWDDIPF